MTRSSIRTLLAGLAGALALCVSVPLFAQTGTTVTISGVACAQWSLTGAAPNIALTCVSSTGASTAPVCTVQGATTGTVGTATSLVARCNPEATNGYTWTGGSCAGKTGMICMANEALTGPAVYTVRGTNAVGQGPVSPPFTVTWVAAPPPAPTGCGVQPYPPSGTLGSTGGPVGMTGSCSGGGTPTAWNWQKSGVAWGTPPNNPAQVDSLPANAGASPITYTYTLTACNGPSCAPAIFTTFTVAGSGTGGGGTGGPDCSAQGFAKTYVVDMASWPAPYPAGQIQAGGNDAIVVRFTVPAGQPPYPATPVGRFDLLEFGGTTTARWSTFTTTPCTWTAPYTNPLPTGVYPSKFETNADDVVTVGSVPSAYPLSPGTTYYINIQNKNPSTGLPTCSGAACYMGVQYN